MYNHLILQPEENIDTEKDKISPIKNVTKIKDIITSDYYKFREKGLEMIAMGRRNFINEIIIKQFF